MRKRRAVKRLIGLLALSLACGLLRLIQPPERLLLSRSTFVTHDARFTQYNWQSDHSILLFRQEEGVSSSRWSLEKVDLLTGHHTFYPQIAKQIRPQSGSHNFETSPDGKWLLWTSEEANGDMAGPGDWHSTGWLANLETGHSVHFPIGAESSIDTEIPNSLYWMTDSRRFVEFDYPPIEWLSSGQKPDGATVIVRNVSAPRQVRNLHQHLDWHLSSSSEIQACSEERLVGATAHSCDYLDLVGGPPELVQTHLKRDASSTQRSPLPVPNMTRLLADVAFSPQGDRYAVAALVDSHPVWLDTLHRWHIPVQIPSHPQIGIWILTMDGKHQQEIGHITSENRHSPSDPNFSEIPDVLRWSPDGKQLAFVYQGDLYRVPSD